VRQSLSIFSVIMYISENTRESVLSAGPNVVSFNLGDYCNQTSIHVYPYNADL
jgi:hypothetical protein